MNQQENYEKKMRAQLDEWKADIELLRAKAQKAEADARLELEPQIEQLRIRYEAAQNRLEELGHASGEAWDDVKNGVELASASLGEAIRNAISRFR